MLPRGLLCALVSFTLSLPLMAETKASKKSHKSLTEKQIHASSLIIDTHADTTQRLLDEDFDLANPPAGDEGNLDLRKAKAGNLAAEFFSIWVEPKQFKGQYAHRTLALIDSVYQQAAKHPDKMTMAFSVADIQRAHRERKFAALLGIEGGHSIENDIHLLRDYHRLGVRYMTLTWSNSNEWADSSGDINDSSIQHHNGLTDFGKDVVREMNRLGMMVDISHVSDKTFYDALLVSRAPIIASHSSSRVLTDHPRNMTDDMLRAIAGAGKGGGVVMVNYYSAFVDEKWRQAYEAQAQARKAAIDAASEKYTDADALARYREMDKVAKQWAAKIPRPPFDGIIDHIDHIAKLTGVDHVGLGSDYDGTPSMPEGMDSAADLPKVTAALVQRGYSAAQIRKILGGNLMRVFREVEQTARELQAEQRSPRARKMSSSQ
jgi:membrane dipeptidase